MARTQDYAVTAVRPNRLTSSLAAHLPRRPLGRLVCGTGQLGLLCHLHRQPPLQHVGLLTAALHLLRQGRRVRPALLR
eukprot:3644027-Pyramimonas_sp.AAC.1